MNEPVDSIMKDPSMPWRVVKAEAVDEYCLVISFADGKTGVFDCKPYLDKGVFKALRDPELFNSAHVAHDTVCWPNDIDIAPERLYSDCNPLAPIEWE